MRTRVRNPKRWAYAYYGARGIDIDPRWDEYTVFLADMGEKPPGFTLERVDNSRGYWPDNCVWATRQVQARNNRRVRLSYEIAEEVRYMYSTGSRVPDLARYYKVSPPHIRSILSRKIWDKP